jgi:hypothetical protein
MSRVPPMLSPRYRLWRGQIPGTHEPGFVETPILERERDANFAAVRRMIGGDHVELYGFRMGECNILLGREPGGANGELRWHLTISCPDRHPTWDEIKTARYRLLGPDTVMAIILPPCQFYVNVAAQDHVMQLWEIADPARIWESP